MTSCAQPYKRVKPALGTLVELTIEGVSPERGAALTTKAFAEIARLERILSRFDEHSELARLNLGRPGVAFEVTDELREVLALGHELEVASRGAFRLMPACPHGPAACYSLAGKAVVRQATCVFDLGGIAKGYIVDRAFELLEAEAGSHGLTVNAGGDLRTTGHLVEVRIPTVRGDARFEVRLDRPLALATSSLRGASGDVGEPSARFSSAGAGRAASAMVSAARCVAADAWTKVALFRDESATDRSRFGIGQVWRFDEQGQPA